MTDTRMPTRMTPVETYGCVRCQKTHFEDTEPELYKAHLMWQSKHGTQPFYETAEERKKRYGL